MPTSSFILETPPIPPQLDLAGAPSQLFQVPPTPSASSALCRSISISTSGRKRSRARDLSSEPRSWLGSPIDRRSPAPFIPSPDDQYPRPIDEMDFYRPSRYREPPRPHPLDASVESLLELSGARRKRSRRDPSSVVAASTTDEKSPAPNYSYDSSDPSQPAPVRWSRAVLGVVGKVWDFCWSGAFRGFYAGGGQGYPMMPPSQEDNTLPVPGHHHHHPYDERTTPTEKQRMAFAAAGHQRSGSTLVPGEYPEDDLRRNWVMVSSRETRDRLDAEESVDAASPSMRTRRVVHRRTNTVPSQNRRRQPGKRALMTHSPAVSAKSQFSSPAKPHESPISVETQRYMAQMRRMEREEDASLQRLNRQLQDMIREGKQALGTRVEVDDFMDE
ncbi:hypothetical protein FE257_009958 [Aspergillus nanangensis]|uniref:Uncharacterized protein n=1 Tax=Aspergillus nanangensis TaxID=2582783 RepID=A0AAD4GZL3_ASPNN|nr:hypothetical protein FE257_009958 [Aspergillus nanangensis]